MTDEKKEPPHDTVKIPKELIELLTVECTSKGYGLGQVVTPNFQILIMGKRSFTPDQIFVLAAYTMLSMVINGAARESNDEKMEDLLNMPTKGTMQ